jgi:NitT/TauT family transport system substrate-binding protein
MRKFGLSRAVFALATLFSLVLPATPTFAQTLPVVRVGATPTDNSGNLYFALDQGYFKSAGLDVQILSLANIAAAAAGLSAGAIDVAQSNVTAIASAHLRGFDFKLFAPAAFDGGSVLTNAIMVAKDSTYAHGSDLNGKTIGVNAVKSVQQVLAMAWVDKNGGDAKTLKFIEMPYSEMGAQLEAHRIDAASVIEPFLTSARAHARVAGDIDDGVGTHFIGLAWGASNAWLQSHTDIARRFASAIKQAGIWANTHPSESADILVKYSKLDPVVAHMMARATYATNVDAVLLQPMIDASAKYGVLEHGFPATEILWSPPAR